MQTHYKYSEITEKIIKAAYNVYNELGYGFLEKIYENALVLEMENSGLAASQQFPINVYYRGRLIGEHVADLVVEEKVIVEIKAVSKLNASHEAQLINYLKATQIEVGLLINFGPKIEIKRKIFDR